MRSSTEVLASIIKMQSIVAGKKYSVVNSKLIKGKFLYFLNNFAFWWFLLLHISHFKRIEKHHRKITWLE